MKAVSCALFLTLLAVTVNGSSCPSNWLNLGELGCYFFAEEAPILSWTDAQSYCNGLNRNAHLAEITNGETNSRLTIAATNFPTKNWWLGGSDLLQVGIQTP